MAELPETQSAECEGVLNSQLQLPEDVKAWTKDHVKHWLLMDNTVNPTIADIIYDQDISGESLLLLETSDLQSLKITLGPAKLILHKRDELVKLKKDQTGYYEGESRGRRNCVA
ncbi:sterile alpha motif domain-containing protein 9-like [Arapaima gigas]